MRWIIRITVFLLLLGAVALVSLLMLPGERIAKIASAQISGLTGREVTMQGDTTVSFWPVLGVKTGKVSVANAGWGRSGPIFTAKSLKIGVAPQVLWGGDIKIVGLEAADPVISLERAADGRVNWKLGVEGVAPSGQSELGAPPARSKRLALTLDRSLITGATFRFQDHGTGERTEIRGMDFDLRWPDYDGRATFDVTLRPAGTPVRITGYLERLGDFIDGGVSDVNTTLTAKGGEVAFAGRVSRETQAEGRLTASLGDTAAFAAALGRSADMPPGLGRSLALDTKATFSTGKVLSLRDTVADLGRGNVIRGDADIVLGGDRPKVKARVDAGRLDLSREGAGDGDVRGTTGGAGAERGWSTTPIDASELGLAEGVIALSADGIDAGRFTLGTTRARITLDRSRLVIGMSELRAYDGVIKGDFVINNRTGLSVGGDMAATGLDLERLLEDAGGTGRLSGGADAKIRFLGVGQSQDEIMNSLSGEGAIRIGPGSINGFDIGKLLRAGSMRGGSTAFEAAGATFKIDSGWLRNDDLIIKLPRGRAEGEGVVGLGSRDIDYLRRPVVLGKATDRGLAIPVRIRGPWSDPKITPDLEKAIEVNFAEEVGQVTDKAEEELRGLVADELGIDREEGQSVEDVLEDKLKQEVRKGLRKLFD